MHPNRANCVIRLHTLQRGLLRGAALDVYETEPLPSSHPFYRMENVLLSPHCADHTPGFAELDMDLFMRNLQKFLNSEPLENVVNGVAGMKS